MPTPGKVIGVQQLLLKQLEKVVEWLLRANPALFPDKNIQIKFTVDGTRISRSAHCVVIVFTILNKEAFPLSPGGNHTVAILNATEDYDILSESLVDIRSKISSIKSVKINGQQYNIEWFFVLI